jgi:O-antigen/teichoic acid export membrane protein
MSKIQKKLFSNILLLVLINFLIKPFWTFGVEIKVLNTIGADAFGFYYAVFNFSFLFHIFIDVGINQFHNREIARTPEKFLTQFSQLFNLKIFFSFIYVTVTLIAAYVVRYNEAQFRLLLILGLNQIILSFILYNRASFTALFRFKLDTFFSIFDKLLSIIICVYIFYFSSIQDSLSVDFKIEYFVYAQTFSLILSFILSFVILLFSEKVHWLRLDFSSFLPYLKKTLPFAIAVLLMTLYTRIDAVMIERLLPETGDYQAGVYAAGYKILDALNRIPYLFASFLIPVFAKLLKNKEDFKPIFSAALKMLLVISIGASIVSLFFGAEVLQLMYKDYTTEWNSSFIYLILSFNTAVLIYVTGGLLTANNNLIAISKMSLVSLLINIILNYFLIKESGAAGASLATLITQSAMAIMQIVLVLKLWKFNFSIQYFIKFCVYTVVLLIASYYLQADYKNIAIIVFLALVMSFAMNLVEWKMFLRNKKVNSEL